MNAEMTLDEARGYLQITLADHEANEFRVVGGAGFVTMAETRQRFRRVPEYKVADPRSEDANLILELRDRDMDILDDKFITRATAEALLSKAEVDAAFAARLQEQPR